MKIASKSFYNIHNFVKVKIESGDQNIHEEYRHYLRYFETSNLDGFNYEIQENKNYKIEKNDGKIVEYTPYANHATNLIIQALLQREGASFVHCAGVEVYGRGVIMPAGGGIGKTTLISYLRKLPSFKFFGDDFVVTRDKEMFSYPSDFSIYPYHLSVYREISNTKAGIFLKQRKYLAWFYFLRRAINFFFKKLGFTSKAIIPGWNASYAKVPAQDLVGKQKIGVRVPIHASVFLERYDGDKILQKEMSSEEVVDKIQKILKEEFKYAYRYAGSLIDENFYNKEKEILTNTFGKIKCYKVSLPLKLSNEKYFEFMDNFLKTI